MEQRHGDKADIILVPAAPRFAGQRALADGAEQRAVREQRPLGKAGGAAGVKLQRNVLRVGRVRGAVGRKAGDPVGKGRATGLGCVDEDNGFDAGGGPGFLGHAQKLRLADQQPDAGITEDIGNFARHQPGVDRHQHRADAKTGFHDNDIIGVVEAEPADAITGFHTVGAQRRNTAQHRVMQRPITLVTALEDDRRLGRRRCRMRGGQFSQSRKIMCHHGLPAVVLPQGRRARPLANLPGSISHCAMSATRCADGRRRDCKVSWRRRRARLGRRSTVYQG